MRTRSIILSCALIILGAGIGVAVYRYFAVGPVPVPVAVEAPDPLFGWKIPVNSIAFSPTGRNLFDFEIAYSDIRDPGGIPQGLPVRLKVPVIGVNTAIEDAYITPDGRMDVPQGSVNVAWFALGPKPGQEGSAVIGGHFGLRNGVPFVFYNLDKLKVGDKVYIEDDKGATLAFVVREIRLFARDADATPVFTSSDGLKHLNLITCEGIWNKVNDTYPLRRVVFTDAIPFDGTVGATTPAVPTVLSSPTPTPTATPTPVAVRSLSFGATGHEVVALQNALVKKGFLAMPSGIAMGTYGASTRTAVSNYQISAGLPSTGIYDSATRALLTAEPALPTTALTPTPMPTATTVPTSPAPQTPAEPLAFVSFVRSLFETATDSLITTLLLVAIIGMAVHIVRHPHSARRA